MTSTMKHQSHGDPPLQQHHPPGAEGSAPKGGKERSDEPPLGAMNGISPPPDPQVVAKPTRRKFSAEYQLRILEELDRCPKGEIGLILRREGLYSSHITSWRRARQNGTLKPGAARKRATKPSPLAKEHKDLKAELERTKAKLTRAEAKLAKTETNLEAVNAILELQGKVAWLLGRDQTNGSDS